MQQFASFFGDYFFIAVIILAMIPALEGRVALPFALSLGAGVLSPVAAYFCCLFGSVLPALPVIFLTRKIKNRFFTGFVHERFSGKLERLNLASSTLKKMVLLTGFVAIPLPMTGVWSGSVIAGLTSLKLWQALVCQVLGSAIACGIILAVCLLFAGSELVVLYISLALLALFMLYELVSFLVRRK